MKPLEGEGSRGGIREGSPRVCLGGVTSPRDPSSCLYRKAGGGVSRLSPRSKVGVAGSAHSSTSVSSTAGVLEAYALPSWKPLPEKAGGGFYLESCMP